MLTAYLTSILSVSLLGFILVGYAVSVLRSFFRWDADAVAYPITLSYSGVLPVSAFTSVTVPKRRSRPASSFTPGDRPSVWTDRD